MALVEGVIAYLPLVPPVLALVLAIWTRNVYWALGGAIWVSEIIIAGGNPFLGLLASVERGADVFSSGYSTRVILFCLVIGALVAFMQRSGGVAALVEKLIAARVPLKSSL